MNSFMKGFNVAKQYTLQKAGKAEASPEDPNFLACLERLHDTQKNFKALSSMGKSVFDTKSLGLTDEAKALLTGEIRAATKLETDYKLAKLDGDAKRASLNSLRNKADAKAESIAKAESSLGDAEALLESLRGSITSAVEELDRIKDARHAAIINSLLDAIQSVSPMWGDESAPAPRARVEAKAAAVAAPAPAEALEEEEAPAAPEGGDDDLPPNWTVQESEDGIYYFNSVTEESSWTKPTE